MTTIETLSAKLTQRFAEMILQTTLAHGEITLVIARENLSDVAMALRDEADFAFNMLVDICGVDYLHYGIDEWKTQSATASGFERGVDSVTIEHAKNKNLPRFAAVYHLLSLTHNHRLRLRVLLEEADLVVPSVMPIWPAADWFEREAFDLFGIMFQGHHDLRRILTDYGFVGHPFRKDFPLIGNVEVRYDAKLKRIVYEPVSIEPRILEPKVIRHDNRYEVGE